MQNTVDKLAKHRRVERPASPIAAPEPQATSGKIPYEAYVTKTNSRFFEIRPPDPAPAEAWAYFQITHLMGELRSGTAIQILVGKQVSITLKGSNLAALYELIKAGNIDYVQEFDAVNHAVPADKNTPFISFIEIDRPEGNEEIPPANQRH